MSLLLSLTMGAAFSTSARADDFEPWDLPKAPALKSSPTLQMRAAVLPRGETVPSIQTTAFWLSFKFYQQVISPIDGPRCAHRPTCSLYAIQAMRKHPFVGPFMALDRLWRSGESSAIRRLTIITGGEGQLYYRDPLEESDFWLH